MKTTISQRVEEIEESLRFSYVLADRQWQLYFSLKPQRFYAKNVFSGEAYDLSGSKNLAAKYFNMLVRNEKLPTHVALIQKAEAIKNED